MPFEILDLVVLTRDLPLHGLRKGDRGMVAELTPPSAVKVEFLADGKRPHLLLDLELSDISLPP
jgi:hypothetical protein